MYVALARPYPQLPARLPLHVRREGVVYVGLDLSTIHPVADFNPFAQNLGSVHCIKKYLER